MMRIKEVDVYDTHGMLDESFAWLYWVTVCHTPSLPFDLALLPLVVHESSRSLLAQRRSRRDQVATAAASFD